MLGRAAGAAIANVPLQEPLQLAIAVGNAVKERRPKRVRRAGRCCCARGLFGKVIQRLWFAANAGAQIEGLVAGS
jgi:hypothetical protein